MYLEQFSGCQSIYIQCHDNPDADAIGAGYGLYAYFTDIGKDVHLIYAGERQLTKPSLLMMVEELSIPLEYETDLPKSATLITVDCQYGGSNVTSLTDRMVGAIDHHPVMMEANDMCYIRPEYGSCCTVVWVALREAGYDVNLHPDVATALYYGLYSDTGQLSEIYHRQDRKMRDGLVIRRDKLEHFIHSNLLREELGIIGDALSDYYYDEERHFALLHATSCDPNLLGVISDLVIQAVTIDYCVVYSEVHTGYKISVRSTMSDHLASRMAESISQSIGAGGGHDNKAGGMLFDTQIKEQYPDTDIDTILRDRIKTFLNEASC